MSDNGTPVYEPGEYCVVCCGTVGLGTMTLPGDNDFTVCAWCHEDKPRLQAWLAQLMQEVLEESPDYERLPDGKYRHVGAPE